MVGVAIAFVEDMFPGFKDMLDVRVCTPAPGSFVRDETLVELACVPMAG